MTKPNNQSKNENTKYLMKKSWDHHQNAIRFIDKAREQLELSELELESAISEQNSDR
ncbi:MAG: hypothetical protein AAFY02_16245 [Pseudomonadota bacterium]